MVIKKVNTRRPKKTARQSTKPKPSSRKRPTGSSRAAGGSACLIRKAESLFSKGKYEAAIKMLKEADPAKLNSDEARLDYFRLLSYSLPSLGKYLEAETYAKKGLGLDDRDYDFYFVLSYVAMTFKDYDKCIINARRFLEGYREDEKRGFPGKRLGRSRLHLMYNYLGIACRGSKDVAEAEKAFREAMRIEPTYSHPYVNLANLFMSEHQYELTAAVIDEGLRNCSQVQELRILRESLENRATISACMIVKDEEELLPACLESIRNWVDEIIVVDTGSTDRTVEIAQSYGAKVFRQEWEGDFSRARNLSLEKANCGWVFVIDADEEFDQEDAPLLRRVVSQEKFRLISVSVYNVIKATGKITSFLPSFRLFRGDAGFKYEGIVHNQLRYDRNEPALRAGIRVRHYGYSLSPEKMNQKLIRSRELLEKQLEERPDDAHVHSNYAQLLRGSTSDLQPETCDLIIEHASRAIELSEKNMGNRLNAWLMGHNQLITTYTYQKKYEEAEKLCFRALAVKPDYLDPILSLGQIYLQMNLLEKAEEYFDKYLEIQATYDESKETVNLIFLHVKSRHMAYYGLGLIAHYRGNASQAEKYFLRALEDHGSYLDINLRLARIYLDRMELGRAIEYLDAELKLNPQSDVGHLYKAEYLARQKDYSAAEIHFRAALETAENNLEVLEKAGCFYASQGRFGEAVSQFEQMVKKKPEYPAGWKLLGKAHYDGGEFESALAAFREYVRLHPGDADVLNDAANCCFKLRMFHDAEELYSEAMKANSELAAAYRNLGLTRLQLRRPIEALLLLEKYVQMNPEDLEIELVLASIHSSSGEDAEAIPHFEKYLSTHPENVEALFGISECYYRLGHIKSAAVGYNQTLKINPDFKPAMERLTEITAVQTPV